MPTLNLKQHSAAPKKNQRLEKSGYRYYNTSGWIRLRDAKLMTSPVCEKCNRELSVCVHHISPFLTGLTENERYHLFNDWDNLMSLCNGCHNGIHSDSKKYFTNRAFAH